VIPNGLALCKLHYAAFDSYIIGVTPDLEVKVRLDVPEEIDFLAERYALFRRASFKRLYPSGHIDTKYPGA